MNFRSRSKRLVHVDITPMVDVVFLLLIFFMVTTTFTNSSGIKLELPQSATRDVEKQQKPVAIIIDKDGRFYVEGEETPPDALGRRMVHATGGDPSRLLVIQADRSARHDSVVFALDTARKNRFSRLAIATAPVQVDGQ